MFINKLQLKNFKRFTDLTIDLTSPQDENSPKLVLLIGANGSGKSCIFDAFETANKIISITLQDLKAEKQNYLTEIDMPNHDYCLKEKDIKNDYEIITFFDKEIFFNFHYKSASKTNIVGQSSLETNLNVGNYFYGRTAFRNIAYLNTDRHAGEFGEQKIDNVVKQNLDRTEKLIDSDQRWETDIVYACTDNIKREVLVNSINSSLNNIFSKNLIGKFQIESIKVDIGGLKSSLALEVLIRKGNSIFIYEYLSAGEKQLFTILLNLHLRKKYLENTIIYLDEIDLHLNTFIQSDLLKEITENLIPDNSQVWVASHSLGFIDYAREYDSGVIIDFDNLNFDEVQILKPEPKDNLKVYEIAVDSEFLAKILTGKNIIFSENKNTGFYNNLRLENIIFFVANDKNDVFHKVKNQENYFGLIDRDYLSDEEITLIEEAYSKLYILKYYCFENYLYHPDNINELKISGFDKNKYIEEITFEKNKVISALDFGINVFRARESYPFFKENTEVSSKNRKQFQDNSKTLIEMLSSPDFEIFYKVLSMKEYCKQLPERQNLTINELASTTWFKNKISEVLG